MSTIIPQKQCPRCKQYFPATTEYFWKDKYTKDGLFSRCKSCGHKKIAREVFPEGQKRCIRCKLMLPDTKEYFGEGHNICRQCVNKRARELHAIRNPQTQLPEGMKKCSKCDQVMPATLEYFSKNKRCTNGLDSWCKQCRADYAREGFHRKHKQNIIRMRQYYRDHPDLFREKAHRRRARILQAGGTFSKSDVRLQFRSQNGKCWHCGKKLKRKYHVDHLIPLVRGGSNSASNIVITCEFCNLSKGDKLPQEWNGRLF